MTLGFMEPQTDKCGWCNGSLANRANGRIVKDLQGQAQDWTFLKGNRKRVTEDFENVVMNMSLCGKLSPITVWRALWRRANRKAERDILYWVDGVWLLGWTGEKSLGWHGSTTAGIECPQSGDRRNDKCQGLALRREQRCRGKCWWTDRWRAAKLQAQVLPTVSIQEPRAVCVQEELKQNSSVL